MFARYFDNVVYFCLAIMSGYSPCLAQIAFDEVGAAYNVHHNLEGSTIGGGISVFDFNMDGMDDLTLSSYAGAPISFYINTGSEFERIPTLVDNLETVKQINWVDFDNDGDPDLYVAANDGVNRLYKNIGGLEFEDITESSGLPLNVHFGYGASWGDYNRDGWLDLYYVSKGIIGNPEAIRSYNRLFKNNANGSFIERTFEANASDEGKLPFCAAFVDYNNDMWPDIYIANDKLTFNTLLENDGKGAFEDVSESTGANGRMNAMCVNPGDYNNDGWMDIYVTNTPVGSEYFVNSGKVNEAGYIQLDNIARELGISFSGGNCWGANFLDADNDGDLDLYVSSSIPSPKDVSSAFFENIDGTHFDAPLIDGFLADTSASYTNAIGDFNNDGSIDIIVQNNPPDNFHLWENKSVSDNHWIKIQLEGVLSNRDGIGTRIESYVDDLYQMQFTLCGSGFLGQNSSYKHIGIGDATNLDSIVITWPSGHIDRLYDLVSNQVVYILEGQTTDGKISVDDDVVIVERNLTTATEQIREIIPISIFPNPSQDFLTLKADKPVHTLEIYNTSGQLLDNYQVNNIEFSNSMIHLESGLYFLKILFDKSHYTFVKWVKF